MAYISPFRALRYDRQRIEIASVVTQPYDKITPEMQDRYYEASPYNLVRIILGKRQPSDTPQENAYTRAAACFHDWRRQGIFRQDEAPSIYTYIQRFEVPGSTQIAERRGFIALGKIEEYGTGVVFRHEQTLAKPKADRLDLLRATCAHFGQLFMLYEDSGEIDSLLEPSEPAALDLEDEYSVQHRVWKVSDPSIINLVRAKMRDKKLIIADGHHRYETALNYRNERRASLPAGALPRERTPDRSTRDEIAPYDMVMMTFVNMNSKGLVVLPTHRVVHGLETLSPDVLRSKAGRYFSVEEVDPNADKARYSTILQRAGQTGTALLAILKDRAFLLDRPKANGTSNFEGYSLRQQSLDVVQLHKCILEQTLGISPEAVRDQTNVRYLRDAGEAIGQVRAGEANAAFLMNPVRMEQVRDIAFAGEVLPQKSTDFYPKLLSGLTIYALE
ncbi:MAG TPA: DUF1015 domain-containing protein [Terriglobales bacterium]|jgi:uncharacterized protein (DUF1015 family)|nr:DUF1015 domain-containing protein [Terriglobales bacterium]